MKKIYIIIFSVMIAVMITRCLAAEADLQTANGISYAVTDSGIVITGYSGEEDNVIIPDEINGIPVVKIGNSAFEGLRSTSISIPDSVRYIGEEAFSGSRITSIVIPDSVVYVGRCAFYQSALETVKWSSSCPVIPEACFFENMVLKSMIIPEGVTLLSNRCFYFCISLAEAELPEGLRFMGYSCFESCYKLESINIPSAVLMMGHDCFLDCKGLKDIYIYTKNLFMHEWFDEYEFGFCDELTAHIYKGSTIEAYLQRQGIPYQYMDEGK